MPFTKQQLDLIEQHLNPVDVEDDRATATIEVSRRDLRFLLQAIQYYHDTCCPTLDEDGECGARVWAEDVHSGALEMSCSHSCQDWISELLSPEVIKQFPPRGARA
ncbi:MAG: hypothetical protein ACYC4L_11165 [Chloroflexota bacterium]